MTCILISGGLVAVDSQHVLPGSGERFISPNKIVAFDAILPLHVKQTTGWSAFGERFSFPILGDFDDNIHGYTVTGSTTHAAKFVDDWKTARQFNLDLHLRKKQAKAEIASGARKKSNVPVILSESERVEIERETLVDCFVRKYHAVHRYGHNNDDEGFTLVLIGEKGCYRYRPYRDGEGVFDFVTQQQTHAYGSGCDSVFELFRQYESHVLAVYGTMLTDPGTDGFVEVWRLPTVDAPELYREGLWNQRTKEQIRELLKEGTDPAPDLICSKAARQMGHMYFDAGAFLGPCPEALKRHRKMMAEDPALGEQSIKILGKQGDPKMEAIRETFMEDWKKKGWVMEPPLKPHASAKASTKASKGERPLHAKATKAVNTAKRKLKRLPTKPPSKRKKA